MKIKKILQLCLILSLSGCALQTRPSADKIPVIKEPVSQNVQLHADTALESLVNNLIMEFGMNPDNMAVVIENYSTGQSYWHNQNSQFIAASLYKLPLAMLYFEMLERGEISEDTLFEFLPEYYEDAGALDADYPMYSMVPLQDLLYYAIVHSDNTAGHILFENLGGWFEYVQLRQKYYRSRTQEEDAAEEIVELESLEDLEEEVELVLAEPAEETGSEEKSLQDKKQEVEEKVEAWIIREQAGEEIVEPAWSDEELAELEVSKQQEADGSMALMNLVSARYMSDCLRLLYEQKDTFAPLLKLMAQSEPDAYLNAQTHGYYDQKYGNYLEVLNIAGLHPTEEAFSVVVLTSNEWNAEPFMGALGKKLEEFFSTQSNAKSQTGDLESSQEDLAKTESKKETQTQKKETTSTKNE